MELLVNAVRNFDYGYFLGHISILKIVIVILILTITQFCRRLISNIIFSFVERLTASTETDLDDELIDILKPALNLIVLLFGFWLVQTILAEEIGPQLNANLDKLFNLIVVIIIGYVVFRAASLLGRILADSILLLFKDIVYDWFCTVIIYTDKLYKEGDWIGVTGIDGFTQVITVGFRSTTLKIDGWGSVKKMPNSQMISGIVDNWSQKTGNDPLAWGLNFTLKIDGLSAAKTAKICQRIRDAIPTIEGMSSKYFVRFSAIEENARVLKIRAFVEDLNLYFVNEEKLNLAILEILEQEGIDSLHVYLRTEPENYQKTMAAANN